MGSGDPPGLQNRRAAGFPVAGVFDSHTLPPEFRAVPAPAAREQDFVCRPPWDEAQGCLAHACKRVGSYSLLCRLRYDCDFCDRDGVGSTPIKELAFRLHILSRVGDELSANIAVRKPARDRMIQSPIESNNAERCSCPNALIHAVIR